MVNGLPAKGTRDWDDDLEAVLSNIDNKASIAKTTADSAFNVAGAASTEAGIQATAAAASASAAASANSSAQAAATNAENSAQSASNSAATVLAFGDTQDAMVANWVDDTGTATGAALSATFAAVEIPQKYGAVADGSTDDSEAIQDAVDAADAAGGGVVFLPAGEYKIGTQIDVPAGVTLRGASRKATVVSYIGSSGYAFLLEHGDLSSGGGLERLTVSVKTSGGSGVCLKGTQSALVEDVAVLGNGGSGSTKFAVYGFHVIPDTTADVASTNNVIRGSRASTCQTGVLVDGTGKWATRSFFSDMQIQSCDVGFHLYDASTQQGRSIAIAGCGVGLKFEENSQFNNFHIVEENSSSYSIQLDAFSTSNTITGHFGTPRDDQSNNGGAMLASDVYGHSFPRDVVFEGEVTFNDAVNGLSEIGSVLSARKSADTSRASTTTAADDNHLTLALPVQVARYRLDAYLLVDATTTGDFKVGLTLPTGMFAVGWSGLGLASGATAASDPVVRQVATAGTTLMTFGGLGAGTLTVVELKGYVNTTGAYAGGSFAIRWAQGATDATATILKSTSFFTLTRFE